MTGYLQYGKHSVNYKNYYFRNTFHYSTFRYLHRTKAGFNLLLLPAAG